MKFNKQIFQNLSLNSAVSDVKLAFKDVLDAEKGRFFLWTPVAYGTGSAVYIGLLAEPSWVWITLFFLISICVLGLARYFNLNKYLFNFIVLFVIFMMGVSVCKIRTLKVAAPIISEERNGYFIKAFVLDIVSTTSDSPKILVAPFEIVGLSATQTPIRLKLNLRKKIEGQDIQPGDAIAAFVIINPPSKPFIPQGYDFARQSWFEGVGGSGFIPGSFTQIDRPKHVWKLSLIMHVNALRWQITNSIVNAIRPEFKQDVAIGGFAAALVTGHQAYIEKQLLQSMRDSGLAHILSISGVHMAIVGGFSFFCLRFLLALVPYIALNFPIKKIAAVLSMLAVACYLIISGMPAPAIRAAIVAEIAFLAILLDRRALSLRALAIAAIIVLTLTPEAVVQPGFQMSFCATAALLALAEAQKPRIRAINIPWWVRWWQNLADGIKLSLIASFVAGAATTPFAVAYFNRFTTYGLISNLFEAPITGLFVMPLLALGTLFSSNEFGGLLLKGAGLGLLLIKYISDIVSKLPGAVIIIKSAPDFVISISLMGIVWLCLIRSRARWIGLILAASIFYWPRLIPPDIWIDPDGANAAINIDGKAYVLRTKVKQYGFEQWVRHYGLISLNGTFIDLGEENNFDNQNDNQVELNRDYQCKSYLCIPTGEARYRVGFYFGKKQPKIIDLEYLCAMSELVVIRSEIDEWPETCNGVNRITKADFDRMGALELTYKLSSNKKSQWLIKSAESYRGQRPWVQNKLQQ